MHIAALNLAGIRNPMTRARWLLMVSILVAPLAWATDLKVVVSHLRGNVYVAEDYAYGKENSIVYVGDEGVTVVGATWTPATAELLAREIAKITGKPIKQVIDTNYHPDRAGGNAYFKSIGADIVATQLTHDLLIEHWDRMVQSTKAAFPDYPMLELVLPDTTFPNDFQLQGGRVQALYLGPSHTQDGIFVFFAEEKVLYGSCILKEQLGNLESANLTEYPLTLRKLKALDLGFTTIVAGHWSAVHGAELVDQYLLLLSQRH